MIDRKSLRIFIPVLLAMIASSVWRLALPDWPPADGPGGHRMIDNLSLFIMPVSLLFFLVSPFILWVASPMESRPSVRRFNGKMIVSWSVFWVVLQGFMLARSLDLVSLSNVGTARGGSVMIGIIFMIFGNFVPKTPVPTERNSLQPSSWRLSRQYRLLGKLFVGLGLAFVLGGFLLPLEYWEPVFATLMLAAFAGGLWQSIKLRQERSL